MIFRSKFIASFIALLIFSSTSRAWSEGQEPSWSSMLEDLALEQSSSLEKLVDQQADPEKGDLDGKLHAASSAIGEIKVQAFPESSENTQTRNASGIKVQAFPSEMAGDEDHAAREAEEDAEIIAEWLSQLQGPKVEAQEPPQKSADADLLPDLVPSVPIISEEESLVPEDLVRQLHAQVERRDTPSGSECVIEPCLRLSQSGSGSEWTVQPKRLQVSLTDQSVQVAIDGEHAPLLFVRDQNLVSWDETQRRLQLAESGSTEIYVVDEQQMMIVPVQIVEAQSASGLAQQSGAFHDALPVVPSELVTLKPLSGLSFGPRKQAMRQMASASSSSTIQVQAFDDDGAPLKEGNQSRTSFGLLGVERERATLRLQLIDERSVIDEDRLYPVKDARVRVLGTSWVGQSDVRGLVEIPDLPKGSRMLVQVDHPGGQIPLHTYEIYIAHDSASTQLEQLTVMTYRSFFLYSQIFQVAQHAERASLCLDLRSRDGSYGLAGIQVALNGDADGPFYFNRFGPDPRAIETDESGRFCWFNVEAGLTEMSFYSEGEYLSSVAIPLVQGSHLDDTIYMWNAPELELRLAAMPTALEQLYSDFDRFMTFHEVDFVDMITIGDNELLWSKEPGVLAGEAGLTWYRGKAYLLAQAPEFESTLVMLSDEALESRGRPMAPLLPRGFAEDLFQELYLSESSLVEAFDPALGSALVLFGQSEEEQEEYSSVRIRLFNQYGRQATEGWYFGSGADGLRKAMFFNLQPGVYTVVVESGDGVWLDFETLAVDYWTTSLVQTGHILGEIF